ncbi:MAG: DUF559 domain-containing protein, partial [Nocardioidaceae bacterium]
CTRGIPATTELRTALDLGGALRRYESLACLDAFIRLGAFSREDLMAELARFNGRRGVVQLRELTALADGRSESTGESWSRLAVIDAGLPTPEPQIWVANEYGEQVYRLDLGYRLSKIAIEYDGERYHQTIEQRQRDKARRAWLRDHGWIVIVVRKEDLTREGRTRFISELREAVAARS